MRQSTLEPTMDSMFASPEPGAVSDVVSGAVALSGDILLVDDTLDNLKILTALLHQRGYDVRGVTTGSAALMGATAQPPDLILLDINMPGMNGYEVCQRLKANPQTRKIPIIFISALDEVFDKVKAFAVGGVDYIAKPFQVEEVFARIENQLAVQRLQTQLYRRNNQLQAAERELSEALERSRSLNDRIAQMTALEERNRIARDIHDSLGHALVALNIQLEAALTLWNIDAEQAHTSLTEAKQLGSNALASVRTSVSAIRSDVLQGKILEQALETLLSEFQLTTQIEPVAKLDLSYPFPNAVNVAVYRIVQEGLTNICKHAQATAVHLELVTTQQNLRLSLKDNGGGFCLDSQQSGSQSGSQSGFGLQGMQERSAVLGGKLIVTGDTGKGCHIMATFPRISG